MSLQTVAAAAYLILSRRRKRQRSVWCRNIFINSDIPRNDFFNRFVADDGYLFKKFSRLCKGDFYYLRDMVAPTISKSDTNFRGSTPPEVKLHYTMKFFGYWRLILVSFTDIPFQNIRLCNIAFHPRGVQIHLSSFEGIHKGKYVLLKAIFYLSKEEYREMLHSTCIICLILCFKLWF
jgi:hypothetical protein